MRQSEQQRKPAEVDPKRLARLQYVVGHESNRMVLNEAAQRLGVSLRQTEDRLIRDQLLATSAFFNCTNGVDGDVPTEITRADIDGVIRALRGNNAYSFLSGVEGENKFGTAPVRDAYFALGHTDMIGQLDAVNGFTQKWNYPSQQSTLDAEWGCVANLRFLLSSVGSLTPQASANGNTVYNNFCVARESFAKNCGELKSSLIDLEVLEAA